MKKIDKTKDNFYSGLDEKLAESNYNYRNSHVKIHNLRNSHLVLLCKIGSSLVANPGM